MLTHNQIVDAVKKAAGKHGINNAYYFGSYAKGTQSEESDLDILVDLDNSTASLWSAVDIAEVLKEELKTNVDVVRLPLPQDTILQIDKVVKCYGNKR